MSYEGNCKRQKALHISKNNQKANGVTKWLKEQEKRNVSLKNTPCIRSNATGRLP